MGHGDRAWMIGTKSETRTHQRNPDHWDHLNELIKQGFTADQWVNILTKNMTKNAARKMEKYLISSFNPQFNCRVGPENSIDKSTIEKIRKLRLEGFTYEQLAEKFDTSRTTIYRIIKFKRTYGGDT